MIVGVLVGGISVGVSVGVAVGGTKVGVSVLVGVGVSEAKISLIDISVPVSQKIKKFNPIITNKAARMKIKVVFHD